MILCTEHPSAPAGWSCTLCARTLCPDCTGWRAAGAGRVELCMHCRGLAQALRVHRGERSPFRSALAGALRWPGSREGLFSMAGLAVIFHSLQILWHLGGLVGDGVALAYLFQIVRHTAAGHDDVPAPEDFRDLFEDVVSPLFRSIFAAAWLVAPLLIWRIASGHSPFREGAWDDPIPFSFTPIALLTLGAFVYPMSITLGALGGRMISMLDPRAILGGIARLGRDYQAAALFCLGCAAGTALIASGGDKLFSILPLPFSGYLTSIASFYLPFAAFRALGLLVRARGDELGYGGSDAYRVPLLEAQPRHEIKPPERAPPLLQPAPREESAPLSPAPRETVARGLELPRGDDAQLPSRLALRMAARDLPGAGVLLREGGAAIPAGTLSAQSWSELAGSLSARAASASGAEKKALAELALLACKRGVEVAPEGALAPQTWLQAARWSDELLGDRARSDRLLSELRQRFPESDEGQFAARRLAAK